MTPNSSWICSWSATRTHTGIQTHGQSCTHWPNVCLCKSIKNFMCQRFFSSVITWNTAKRMRLRALYADCELLIVPSFRDLLSELFIGCLNYLVDYSYHFIYLFKKNILCYVATFSSTYLVQLMVCAILLIL